MQMKNFCNKLFICFLLMSLVTGCGMGETADKNYIEEETEEMSDEKIEKEQKLLDEEETFITNSSQIKSDKISEKIEKNESDYFGIWNECLPVFSENTEVYINIENSLRFHADEVKEEFEKELEEWILYVDTMDKEKIESHMDWIQESGLVVGNFIVEEVHYQSDQYIVFLVRCGSVENITPPRGYRYKMFSYNLETGQEMTLSNFNLEKEDWTQILENQYMILCDQFPETYNKKYIKKIIEEFNPEAFEEYANDLYYFSNEGIMFYFNRSITNDEMNTDSNASSSGSDYPGIFWEKMKLYNHFLIPYENLLK